ncbi:MAG: biosynthetic-type acetolactate synthase large subunit [Chloroflexi bacterium]|nr:biosynthetic-type acetolactate synthase large subunit [Chloroflexota bacterium]MYF21155.1 biosynthetic-type acetolactate synthase large subunit [Chloroflexota bacterium]
MRLTGARILMECLRAEGVEVFFGYPGGVVLPLYNTLGEYPDIKHVLVRHEQAAAHAADGYARVAGRTGVCLATSGPGATNLVTGITTAYMDSVPMVVLTGNVARDLIGRDGFQEADITGITLPITKHNYLLMRASEIAPAVKEAFHIASTGRKGPVLVDIPKDVFIEEAEWDGYPQGVSLRGYPIMDVPREEEVDRAAEAINAAKKPIIIAGHGVVQSEAQEELVKFAELSDTPVLTTLLGISGMPEDHELSYGFLGMHGHFYANMAADRADVVIGIGMRFDDRAMGRFSDFNPTAKIVHIDIDPAEIGKNFVTHAPVNGDVKETLSRLLPQIELNRHPEWRAEIDQIMTQHPTDYIEEGTALSGPWLVQALAEATQGDSTIVTGVGQHQMWAAQYYPYTKQRQWVTSGGLGTMGYEVPAAMGAQFAQQEPIWSICGDGGFQMTSQELQTVADHNLPVRFAIFNNGFLGMVRQWQELFYEHNYHSVDLGQPDFVKLAEAYGVRGVRATTRAEAMQLFRDLEGYDGPVVIDFQLEREENVWPMVPAGAALSETIESAEDL